MAEEGGSVIPGTSDLENELSDDGDGNPYHPKANRGGSAMKKSRERKAQDEANALDLHRQQRLDADRDPIAEYERARQELGLDVEDAEDPFAPPRQRQTTPPDHDADDPYAPPTHTGDNDDEEVDDALDQWDAYAGEAQTSAVLVSNNTDDWLKKTWPENMLNVTARSKVAHLPFGFDNTQALNAFIKTNEKFLTFWRPLEGSLDGRRLPKYTEVTKLMHDLEKHSPGSIADCMQSPPPSFIAPQQLSAWALFHVRRSFFERKEGEWGSYAWTDAAKTQRAWMLLLRARNVSQQTAQSEARKNQPDPNELREFGAPADANVIKRRQKTLTTAIQRQAAVKQEPLMKKRRRHAAEEADQEASAEAALSELEAWAGQIPEDLRKTLLEMDRDDWHLLFKSVTEEELAAAAEHASHRVEAFKASKKEAKACFDEVRKEVVDEDGKLPTWHSESHQLRFWQLLMLSNVLMGLQTKSTLKPAARAQHFLDLIMTGALKSMKEGEPLPGDADMATRNADGQEQAQRNLEKADENMLSEGQKKKIQKQLLDLDMIPVEALNEDSDQDWISKLMAKTLFERTNFLRACLELRVDVRTGAAKDIRIAFMKATVRLYWWQLTGIRALRQMRRTGKVRGGILCDKVGLGKTFTIAGTMLQDYTDFVLEGIRLSNDKKLSEEERLKKVQEHGSYKPWLVCVPTSLIHQTAEELQKFSARFQITVYHSNAAKHVTGLSDIKKVSNPMTADHEAMQPSKKHCKIIITTLETFAHRHGPNPLQHHRMTNAQEHNGGKELSDDGKEQIKKLWDVPHGHPAAYCCDKHTKWAACLDDCWSGVFVDEAHSLKSDTSVANRAIANSGAPFILGATATPIPSGHFNMTGYLSILEMPENVAAFQRSDKHRNPYLVPREELTEDDERAMLSAECWEHHICRPAYYIDPLVKDTDSPALEALSARQMDGRKTKEPRLSSDDIGRAMERVFAHICVRRTYPSFIPGQEETTRIGKSLPKLYRYTLQDHMNPKIKALYEAQVAHFSGRILMKESRTFKGSKQGLKQDALQTNSNVTRALSLASLCPALPFITLPLRHVSQFPKEKQGDDSHLAKMVSARNAANGAIIEDYIAQQEAASGKQDKKKNKAHKKVEQDGIGQGVTPLEPYHYRDDEWSITEVDQISYCEYLRNSKPADVPYHKDIFLLREFARQIGKNEDAGAFGRRTCGKEIVDPYLDEHGNLPDPSTLSGREKLASIFCDWSPRLKSLLSMALKSIARKEKLVLWVNYPLEQYFLNGLLRCFGLHSEAFLANLEPEERSSMKARFNSPMDWANPAEDAISILICNYAIGGVGLNLQPECCNTILVLPPNTHADGEQAIGRVYRIGQKHDVYAISLFVLDTHDDWLHQRNMKRTLAELRANLDLNAFRGHFVGEGEEVEDADPTEPITFSEEDFADFYMVPIDLSDEAEENVPRKLMHVNKMSTEEITHPGIKIASMTDILCHLFSQFYGPVVPALRAGIERSLKFAKDGADDMEERRSMGAIGPGANLIDHTKLEVFYKKYAWVPERKTDLYCSFDTTSKAAQPETLSVRTKQKDGAYITETLLRVCPKPGSRLNARPLAVKPLMARLDLPSPTRLQKLHITNVNKALEVKPAFGRVADPSKPEAGKGKRKANDDGVEAPPLDVKRRRLQTLSNFTTPINIDEDDEPIVAPSRSLSPDSPSRRPAGDPSRRSLSVRPKSPATPPPRPQPQPPPTGDGTPAPPAPPTRPPAYHITTGGLNTKRHLVGENFDVSQHHDDLNFYVYGHKVPSLKMLQAANSRGNAARSFAQLKDLQQEMESKVEDLWAPAPKNTRSKQKLLEHMIAEVKNLRVLCVEAQNPEVEEYTTENGAEGEGSAE